MGRMKGYVSHMHVIWQILFYFLPLILLVVISFWTLENYQLHPSLSLENYKIIFSERVYLDSIFISIWLAFITACLSTVIGLPISHAIRFHVSRRFRLLVVFLLLIPFFSSYTIRMFSWQLWINDRGILAFILQRVGIHKEALDLIYTQTAVTIGLLSFLIPIASLIIYLSISKIDETLILAALNLGASRVQVFRMVTFPYVLPAISLAFLLTFIISFGDFISPSILGGNQVYTVSTLIADRVKINDWPSAAALGTLVLSVCTLAIVMIFVLMNRLTNFQRAN